MERTGCSHREGKRRRWLLICATLAGIFLAGIARSDVARLADPVRGNDRADFPDYSAMLAFYAPPPALRMPTATELQKLSALWPTVPPKENAAFYYAKAASLRKSTDGPDGANPGSMRDYGGDLAALERWVAAHAGTIEAIHGGTELDYCAFPIFIDAATGQFAAMQRLEGLRQVGRVLSDAGFVAELKQEPDRAVDYYLTCIRFGHHVQQGIVIEQLVGCGIAGTGEEPLERLLANSTPSEETLQRIMETCREAEPDQGELVRVLDRENAWIDTIRTPRVTTWLFLTGDERAIRRARKEFGKPLPELMKLSGALALMEEKSSGQKKAYADLWVSLRWLVHQQVRLRALRVRAALELYRQRHGSFPESLDALVPVIMPELPLDPFDERPLRYERTVDGWRLWSIGPDLKDDGGESAWMQQCGYFWQGKDYVFVSSVDSTLIRRSRMETHAEEREKAGKLPSPDADALGLTPLHHAANRGKVDEVRALLEKGSEPNARGLLQQTPLHLAVNSDVAAAILDKDGEIDARDRYGRTPLYNAAGAGRKDVVELLLARGADESIPEQGGTDPMLEAMMAELSKQVPGVVPPQPAGPRTPAVHAAANGHDEIAEILRKHAEGRGEGE